MRQRILPCLFAAPLSEMRPGREGIRRFPELKLFELVYSLSPKTFHRVSGAGRTSEGSVITEIQFNR
jgi:hypothetical protein